LDLYDKFTSRFQPGAVALFGIYPMGNQVASFGEIRGKARFEGGRVIERRFVKVDGRLEASAHENSRVRFESGNRPMLPSARLIAYSVSR